MSRSIEDVLLFRGDILPFLVHLTRNAGKTKAGDVLRKIITASELQVGKDEVSHARFGIKTSGFSPKAKLRYFGAVCLTETPINEIHCLLDVANRRVELAPYGLVFLKDRLLARGVCPAIYLNNTEGVAEQIVQALGKLIKVDEPSAAKLLPLIAVFGKQLTAPGAAKRDGQIDFRWEREWRLPSCDGPLHFDADDVFVGICPHDEIDSFENLFPGVGFIDPYRNMKWYATKLVEARQRHDLKHSVV